MEQSQASNPAKPIVSPLEPSKKVYDPFTDPLTIWKNGRPYKFKTLDEPKRLIDGYFEECEILGKTPNVAGLSLALETDYKTMIRWENLESRKSGNGEEEETEEERLFRQGLGQLIRRAKTKCAEKWFPGLEDRDKARGSEFALKVMGYQDKPENQSIGQVTINQQNNVLVGNPAHLEALFHGMLPDQVQKALGSQGQGE